MLLCCDEIISSLPENSLHEFPAAKGLRSLGIFGGVNCICIYVCVFMCEIQTERNCLD